MLDLVSINVSLNLSFDFMSCMKKILFVVAVLFGVEFLGIGFFTYGDFSWTMEHIPRLIKAASHADTDAIQLDSPDMRGGRVVREMSGELKARSLGLLTTTANAEFSFRNSMTVPHRVRTIVASKVSRCISIAVLNI